MRMALPDGRVWLRVAEPEWTDPLDPSYAGEHGGRWNPPGSFSTLYLNADPATARLQVEHMLDGSPARIDDLDDNSYVLVAATLPAGQQAADGVSASGLERLRLPDTYPCDPDGARVGRDRCQRLGMLVREDGLHGVWCRSACTRDGRGRELAWFPSDSAARAQPVWRKPLPLGEWRDAAAWTDIDLREQPDPAAG